MSGRRSVVRRCRCRTRRHRPGFGRGIARPDPAVQETPASASVPGPDRMLPADRASWPWGTLRKIEEAILTGLGVSEFCAGAWRVEGPLYWIRDCNGGSKIQSSSPCIHNTVSVVCQPFFDLFRTLYTDGGSFYLPASSTDQATSTTECPWDSPAGWHTTLL